MSASPLTFQRGLGLGTAAVIYLIDQLAKYLVTAKLNLSQEGTGSIVIAPFFNLTFTENRGVSMGFFQAETETARWMLVAMLAVVAGLVAWWLWREKARQDVVALGLVLGGALGNITDRVRLGYVIDYADFHIGAWRPFLIFNLADAAISIGVFILLARALLLREKSRPPKESRSDA